jgi:small conductance mechanosensitive channel
MPSLTEELTTRFDNDPEAATRLIAWGGEVAVKLVLAVIILCVTAWLSGFLSKAIRNAMGRYSQRHSGDTTLSAFVGSVVRYAIWIIGLIAVLGQVGVQTTSILTVLGAASLAIGLALQGALSNVAAGVMLLILRPYRVGDTVEISGREGRVRKLDLFTTELAAFDGLVLVVPNGKVLGDMIINFTASGRRRMQLDFGIDYDDDVDVAIETLLRCAAEEERVLKEPAPWAKVTALADSSVVVSLRAWTEANVFIDTKFDMIRRVKLAFDDTLGVSFPYPHQVALTRAEARGDERPMFPAVFPLAGQVVDMEAVKKAAASGSTPSHDGGHPGGSAGADD